MSGSKHTRGGWGGKGDGAQSPPPPSAPLRARGGPGCVCEGRPARDRGDPPPTRPALTGFLDEPETRRLLVFHDGKDLVAVRGVAAPAAPRMQASACGPPDAASAAAGLAWTRGSMAAAAAQPMQPVASV